MNLKKLSRISIFLRFAIAMVAMAASQLGAQILFSDGFESYNPGALDANLSGGPNQSPNGGPGNPWFGPGPPNLQVVGTTAGVTPYDGAHMAMGSGLASDFDQDWYNISYRANGGSPISSGNVALTYYFYDAGGGANNQNYMALGNYTGGASGAPTTSDYTASSGGNLNGSTSVTTRLSLGTGPTGGTFNSGVYQARIPGLSGGYTGGTAGWFNTTVARSVGWHQMQIAMGAVSGGSATVNFSIDGSSAFSGITTAPTINVIEFDAEFASVNGYFDDVTLTSVPEPGTCAIFGLGLVGVLALRKRGKQ